MVRSVQVQNRTAATRTETQPSQTDTNVDTLVLRLRPPQSSEIEEEQRVSWENGIIDNEGMGKKSSKKCCVFHKKKRFDESDTESEGEDSDSEDEFRKLHPDAL